MTPGINGEQFSISMGMWSGATWRYRVPMPKKHRRFYRLYRWAMGVLEDPVAVEDGYSYPVKILEYPKLGWKSTADKPKRARILKQNRQ